MKIRQEFIDKIAYCCFYIAVITEVLIVIIDKSSYTNPIEGRLFQITFFLFLMKLCLTKYVKREVAIMTLFFALGVVSYFATGRNEIVRFVTFVASCKGIDMQQCLKRVFYLTLIGCIGIMLLSITGIYGAVSLTQDYGRGMTETRYTFGMGHPNALQCMVWALTTLGLYLYHRKISWYHYVVVFLVNMSFFLLTDSKTAMLASIYVIFAFAIITFVRHKLFVNIFLMGNIFLSAVSVVLSVMIAKDAMSMWEYYTQGVYTPKAVFLSKLDGFLTGRIASLFETINFEGTMQTWSLFSETKNNYYFDMGWIRLFYWYGIIPAGIAVLVLFIFFFYFFRRRKSAEIVLMTAFVIYTIMEAHIVSVYIARNYVLFIIAMYWCQIDKDWLAKDISNWKYDNIMI